MITEFANDPYQDYTCQTKASHRDIIKYLRGKIKPDYSVLDIGQRNPLTEKIEKVFGVKVDNTVGDLDTFFLIPETNYDVIIYSHTIEHQFNPLNALLRIKLALKGKLYIILPSRPRILHSKGHYHEIDNYRMKLLLKHAGYVITDINYYRTHRPFVLGIRPVLRLFLDWNVIYECMLKY